MKTNLTDTPKTKKVWQKPTLTVMSSTQQIQGGNTNQPYLHEAGQANGNFYLAPHAFPGNKFSTPVGNYNNYAHS